MKATGPKVRDIRRVVKRLRGRWYTRAWYRFRRWARLYWCEKCRKRWQPSLEEPRPVNAICGILGSGKPFEQRYVCNPCLHRSQEDLRQHVKEYYLMELGRRELKRRAAAREGGSGGNSQRQD